MVAFTEAGAVYDDLMPIRVDFAVPLNRRNAVDDAFQILISLGQAF